MIKSLLIPIFCTLTIAGFSQEMVVDLIGNGRLGAWEKAERLHAQNSRALGDTLDLPFFDDFSEPFSRLNHPHDLYPSLDLWIGNTVYVNNHMAINPISQGVATFDGLDENGRAYGYGFSTPTLSDSLTSKPLNLLAATDSVYLSFYYQAQGLGNAPELLDLLALEFKDSSDTWHRVWDAEGYILEDYEFNRVMLPISGDDYLFNGFQFRFLNYASRAGNVDHWHIDYIELDQGRGYADTLINDLSYMDQTSRSAGYPTPADGGIVSQTASILDEYHSMPWTHYQNGDTTEYMLDSLHIMLRNNFQEDKQMNFQYKIYDELGAVVQSYEATNGIVIIGDIVCGSELNDCNDESTSNFRTSLDSYYIERPPTLQEDSVYFLVEYGRAAGIIDDVPSNDKHVFKQEFYNYYSYDDGTAELAYGLGNLENEGKVAVKFDIKKADSIQAIQIYLNPVEQDLSEEPVTLAIWSGNEEPTDLLYESPEFINMEYTDGVNYFYNYALEEAIYVEEQTIWVGWTQQAATGVKFSVGLDLRNDVSSKVFYHLGATWNQSSIPGAIMIRPIFGNAFDWVAGIEEQQHSEVVIYPNPTTGTLNLQEAFAGEFRNAELTLFDLTGRQVFSQFGYNKALDLTHLVAGTYIIDVKTENGKSYTQRVVLQP